MAIGRHDARAMPKWRPPPAPVLMRPVRVEDEPAPLHLGVPEFLAAETRHLLLAQGQVHVLGRVAVQIVNPGRTVTSGEIARRIRV
jgi:hypothetical protein